MINDSPLEKGWIVKMTPKDLTTELRSLFKGVTADRWQEAVPGASHPLVLASIGNSVAGRVKSLIT